MKALLLLLLPYWLLAQEVDTLAVDEVIESMQLEENKSATEVQAERSKFIINQLNTKSLQSMQQLKGVIRDPDREQGVAGNVPAQQKEEVVEKLAYGIIDDPTFEMRKKARRISGPSQFDSRIELRDLKRSSPWQSQIIKNSESIGLIIEKEALSQITVGTFSLDISKTLGGVYHLCDNVAFGHQPVAGRGTAFIYNGDSMLTAAHVIERKITDYIVLFGYRVIHPGGAVENFFDEESIFYPTEIISHSNEADVIRFRVNRPFHRPALTMAPSKSLANKSEVYMIGYPSGLPLKVALNASLYDNGNQQYFYTSLDSFQGNSGSPVFDFNSHAVIGILVSGEVDYVFNGNCYDTPSCTIPYCKGEKVMRIETVTAGLDR